MIKGNILVFPKISVILPVYNVDEYLSKCLDSILAQTFVDFEVILVNDGSTDNSANICEEYVLKDSRVHAYHQNNSGVSSARNRGIEKSKGEYICFIDSDDWVESHYLSDFLFDNLENDNSLVIQTYIYYEYTNEPHKSNWRFTDYEHQFYQGADIVKALLLSNFFVSKDGGPVGKLFQKKTINQYNIRFTTNISAYEDVIFSLKYISKVDSLFISNGKNYHYLHRKSHISLSRKKHPYLEYICSAEEGEIAINYLFKRFNVLDFQIVKQAKIKMLEIRLNSISALYSSEILACKKERLTLLTTLKNTQIELLKKYYKPNKIKAILTKKILLMESSFVSDLIFVVLFTLSNILKKVR